MTTFLFLIPLLVGLVTQFSKRFFNKNWHSEMTAIHSHLPHYGGMPSAHTAFAFSLLTVIAWEGEKKKITCVFFFILCFFFFFFWGGGVAKEIFLGPPWRSPS